MRFFFFSEFYKQYILGITIRDIWPLFGTLALIETLECYTKDVIERSHDKNFRR